MDGDDTTESRWTPAGMTVVPDPAIERPEWFLAQIDEAISKIADGADAVPPRLPSPPPLRNPEAQQA